MSAEHCKITHQFRDGILCAHVSGSPELGELVVHAENHWEDWNNNALILWDLRAMDSDRIQSASLQHIGKQYKTTYKNLLRRRTAHLVGSTEIFGLCRMVQSYSEMNNVPIEFGIFYTLEEAKSWLTEAPDPLQQMSNKPGAGVSHSIKKGVLWVKVSGAAEIEKIVEYSLKHLDLWTKSHCLLWDLREMSFDHINAADIRNLTVSFAEANQVRAGKKTAMLVHTGEGMGLGRMVQSHSAMNNSPIEHEVFDTVQGAISWLNNASADSERHS